MANARFDLNGLIVPADVIEQEVFESPHTGKRLERVTAEISTRSEVRFAELQEMLKEVGAGPVYDVPADASVEPAKWKVLGGPTRLTFNNSSGWNSLTVELEEHEELNVTRLVVADREFRPYYYHERVDGPGLVIHARIKISHVEFEDMIAFVKHTLRSKETQYFDVVREGISEEPRKMRFGQGIWSEDGDEVKYEMLLVDASIDAQDTHRRTLFSNLYANEQMTTNNVEMVNGLTSMLVEKGLLTEAEVARVAEQAEHRSFRRLQDLHKEYDIDEDIT